MARRKRDAEAGEPAQGLVTAASPVNLAVDAIHLAMVVDQIAESVVITDLDGRITYVNPAFERASGYRRDELIGQNPRIVSSGRQPPAFYTAMWKALTNGESWTAEFVNRRKDGSLFTEESVVSPIRDGSGVVTNYVAVKHDVTLEREMATRALRFAHERALIANTISALHARSGVEDTAQAMSRQVLNLSGVCAAQFFVFETSGHAMPIGFVVGGKPDPELRRLPIRRSRTLHERARQGPWIEPWINRPWHPYNDLLVGIGVHLAGYAPMRAAGRVAGLLVVDFEPTVDERAATETLVAMTEFADLASAILGPELVARMEVNLARELVRQTIAGRDFHPVFQPIVDLETGETLGYEALTRFGDRVSPDLRFAAAAAADLGMELEIATLEAAIAASVGLPPKVWLNLNVSPALVLEGTALRRLLRRVRRRVVLEITEHAEIIDYAAFRATVGKVGARVDLAIDDAGAGFSSLKHIVELRPAYVKLDRGLVTDLDRDEARQAMIVGLRHFARATGCKLIAEGVETPAELASLRALGIRLGQGFLLGRPAPLGQG